MGLVDLVGASVAVGLLVTATLWIRWSLLREDVWAISIYSGREPLSLHPSPRVASHPVLTHSDVSDVRASFVADPFLIRTRTGWYMFFEVLDAAARRGVIAVASSEDGFRWRYERVVLREPFHLSYPYVFAWESVYYMLPETGEASAVRLYRAVEMPQKWEFVTELLQGKYWDPSIIRRDDLWWLFAVDETASLTLHFAEHLEGPWMVHPCSPLVRANLSTSRPGGRLIEYQGKVLRFAQDGVPTYGSRLRVLQIDELTRTSYREQELASSPILAGSGAGWNRTGMHHADVHEVAEGEWLASVDGNRQRLTFNWRAGARRIANLLCDALRSRQGRIRRQ